MSSPSKPVREFLHLSRAERIGLGIIMLIIFLVAGAHFFMGGWLASNGSGLPPFKEEANVLDTTYEEQEEAPYSHPAILFEFDPNTVSEDSLLLLGLSNWSATNLIRYREKGGIFRKAADLKKIYGLQPEAYTKLEPYIRIKPEKAVRGVKVNIATADSLTLLRVHGIGPVFAGRIVRYREKLGGFTDISQLQEVYGLTAEVYAGIVDQLSLYPATELKQLDINHASAAELAAHPYIGWRAAKAIVNYREKHGDLRNIGDMEQALFFDNNSFVKVKSYVIIK